MSYAKNRVYRASSETDTTPWVLLALQLDDLVLVFQFQSCGTSCFQFSIADLAASLRSPHLRPGSRRVCKLCSYRDE